MWHEVFNISRRRRRRRTRRIKEINQAKTSADFVAASKDQLTKPNSSQNEETANITGDIKSVDAAVLYITTSCIADCCYPTLRHGKQGKFLWWRGLSDLFTDQSPAFPWHSSKRRLIYTQHTQAKTDDERTKAPSTHQSTTTKTLLHPLLYPWWTLTFFPILFLFQNYPLLLLNILLFLFSFVTAFRIFPFFPEKNLTVFALNQSCDNARPMKKKKKSRSA